MLRYTIRRRRLTAPARARLRLQAWNECWSPTGSRAAPAGGRRVRRRLSREPPAQLGVRAGDASDHHTDRAGRGQHRRRVCPHDERRALLPCVMQYGPGAEAAFAAVAQAFGDRSPILLIPGEHAAQRRMRLRACDEEAYRPITRLAATVNEAAHGTRGVPAGAASGARRARRAGPRRGGQRRAVRRTPVPPTGRSAPAPRRSQADPADVGETARILPRRRARDRRRAGRALRGRDGRARAARRAHRHRRWRRR